MSCGSYPGRLTSSPEGGRKAGAAILAPMLTLALLPKLLAEIALLAWAGQALLGALIGARREHNGAWRLLGWVLQPWLAGVRRLAPRAWPERRVRALALALLLALWLLGSALKLWVCLGQGLAGCR